MPKYYSLPAWNKQIGAKIRANWGISRLFNWLKGKCPIHGESLVLASVLLISKQHNRQFKKRSISRVINREFEEKLPTGAKRYLLDLVWGKIKWLKTNRKITSGLIKR